MKTKLPKEWRYAGNRKKKKTTSFYINIFQRDPCLEGRKAKYNTRKKTDSVGIALSARLCNTLPFYHCHMHAHTCTHTDFLRVHHKSCSKVGGPQAHEI